MNERFLAKAKCIKSGEWVEGYYCRISETTYCPIGDVPPVPVHHYILHETMTPSMWLGTALALGGLVLSERDGTKKENKSKQ